MLFGTSGIRGLYGEFVNEKLAMGIANLFAEKDVVIARDTRTTGESLAFAAISGVLARGRNAIYIDIAPTPTLALATKKYKCRGIMITASHNPPEYNGLKLFANGVEVSRKVEREVESEFNKGMRLSIAKWDVLGKLGQYDNAIAKHKKMIIGLVNSSIIKKKRPKVVIDPNGAGAVITASLLQEIGCETVSINDGLRGFERASEPNAENLKGLAAKVRELKADLGIGHDGDADRTVVVDEKGEVLPLDVQLAIMIEHELGKARARKKEATVVSTVEASLCVREAIERAGAEAIITPVGSLYVSEELERNGAVFGGEPCGEYVFANGLHVPDGILTAAKFVEIFCEKGKLSALRKKYKTYPMIREKFKCENSRKYEIVERVRKKIENESSMNEIRTNANCKIRTDDGIRIDETDGWFLIRASGTEPYVRLTMEYKDKKKLETKFDELKLLIKQFI